MAEHHILIKRSDKKTKKYVAIIDDKKKVHFGQKGMSDFTQHHDVKRQERYIERHKSREDWTITGIKTAGFFSRWLLWNQSSIDEAARNIEEEFNVVVDLDI